MQVACRGKGIAKRRGMRNTSLCGNALGAGRRW